MAAALMVLCASMAISPNAGAQDTGPASIGGTVFEDLNRNGINESGEPGLPGVIVYARDLSGVVAGSDITDAAGAYLIDNLANGDYQVEVRLPLGRNFTAPNIGSDDSIDSDVDPASALTGVYTVAAGDAVTSADAGVLPLVDDQLASIGGLVFWDEDRDGVRETDDIEALGVTVRAYDADDIVVGETVTDATGAYLFDALPGGEYYLEFDLPDGLNFTLQDQGGDEAFDSDVDPTTGLTPAISLAEGQSVSNIDAGIRTFFFAGPGSIDGFVFVDVMTDGVYGGRDVLFGGVVVDLVDAAGQVLMTATTENGGGYSFSDLAPGEYFVKFVLPSDELQFVWQFDGSNPDSETGIAGPFTLIPGANRREVLAGIFPLNSGVISGTVFDDRNENGIQDPDEPGVQQIGVELSGYNGGIYSNVVTDESGNYSFTQVGSWDYFVKFTLPADARFTAQNVGDDDAKDSDVDPANGYTDLFGFWPDATVTGLDAGLIFSSQLGNGDVNCDGFADIIDAFLIAGYEVSAFADMGECPTEPRQLYADRGDIDGDGAADIIDALFISQCDAGMSNDYCSRMNIRP